MRFFIASIVIVASFLFVGAPAPALADFCTCSKSVTGGPQNVFQGCLATEDACTAKCFSSDESCTCTTDPVTCPEPVAGGAAADKAVGIPLPLGNVSVQGLIGRIIKTLLGLVGSLALVMFIYGGFMYMTSAGNEDKVTKGKNTIVWAVLGLIAVFSAYAVVDFIITQLNK